MKQILQHWRRKLPLVTMTEQEKAHLLNHRQKEKTREKMALIWRSWRSKYTESQFEEYRRLVNIQIFLMDRCMLNHGPKKRLWQKHLLVGNE
jgi:hypothetical protein